MTRKLRVDDMVSNVHTLAKKNVVGDCPAWLSKTGTRQRLCWQPNSMQGQVEMYRTTLFSGYCWVWGYSADDPLMCLCWPSVIANYAFAGPGNITTGPWISGRDLPGQMNHRLAFITPMAVSGYVVFQATNCSLNLQQVIHRPVVAVLCFGEILLDVSEACGYGRSDLEC